MERKLVRLFLISILAAIVVFLVLIFINRENFNDYKLGKLSKTKKQLKPQVLRKRIS